jgi:hypothetical protein
MIPPLLFQGGTLSPKSGRGIACTVVELELELLPSVETNRRQRVRTGEVGVEDVRRFSIPW